MKIEYNCIIPTKNEIEDAAIQYVKDKFGQRDEDSEYGFEYGVKWLIEKFILKTYIFEIDDIVGLPFNETGKIIRINTKMDWYPYKVKIRKATLNKTNEIIEFKKDQLKPIL